MFRRNLTVKNKAKLAKKSGYTIKKLLPDDWISFANLCKIRSGTKVINFNPYDYQKH